LEPLEKAINSIDKKHHLFEYSGKQPITVEFNLNKDLKKPQTMRDKGIPSDKLAARY
jgi:hypothetical protein